MASTSSQIPSSSASTPTRWDVFLSFRGPDTRFKFTSHLYAALDRHGIRTFKDDPELRTGEVISDALIQAIHQSKTYIVVFSENYASSSWCLDELVEIYGCYETMQRSVIAVFYNIDPSVVRHQTESFKQSFEKHEARFASDIEKVKKWRLTLKQVAGFSGKHVSANTSEADIIEEIVNDLVLQLNPMALDVAKYPVGLDSRVKDITTLLSSDTEQGVIRIGIYGMGGVGKTTLAKALYNKLLLGRFKGCCFLANVREVSGSTKGLVSLQQQLIDDVLKSKNIVEIHNVDEGTKFIKERICATKVLVVIDDLDHHKQFESLVGPFAHGSVVIITTRDEEILDTIEVETRYRYRVNELDDAESLTLFTRHAFGNAKPNNTLMVLSKDVLRHAGGLPLALEVYGSYLYKRPEVGWKYFIEKLQRLPDRSIYQRLVISLDVLELDDPMLKKMFIDISCFFIGWGIEDVVTILETYYPYADHNIDILRKRCLLTINNHVELRMHDLLRDIGREIARNNSPDDPQKHSRLWVSEDIHDVLSKDKGTEAVEGIVFPGLDFKVSLSTITFESESFSTETFKRMSKLRFLSLKGFIYVTGSFKLALEDLRWLRWVLCPLNCLPSDFYPQKLVILELHMSDIRTWELNRVFHKLKILDMRWCTNLTTTPDFSRLPCLEALNLEGCSSLEEVHMSIGSLVRLLALNLRFCKKLRSLPDSICNLRALKRLNIADCSSLEAVPIELENIEFLTELNACSLTVSKLPDSMGSLSSLVELDLSSNSNLKTLPDSICNLKALRILNIDECYRLETLPLELGNIESLTVLHASFLTVSKLPDSIAMLSKLVELILIYNENLETLPDTISSLRSLEILDISQCKNLKELPDQLWNITSLCELKAWHGNLLKIFPDTESSKISSSLETLNLAENFLLTSLPSSISQLLNLEELDLRDCHHLLSVEALPPNLKWIMADGCTSMERLPNLSSLKQLEELDLTNCRGLTEIVGLEALTSIEILHLAGCNSSLLANIFTERFFQIYSGFGHEIKIYAHWEEFPDWMRQSIKLGSTVCLDLLPNMSHNFLGMVLCFPDGLSWNTDDSNRLKYSLKSLKTTTSSDFVLSRDIYARMRKPVIVIVPRSIFSVRDGDYRIELTAKQEISGIHLLYKSEITIIDEYTTINVDLERNHPSQRLKRMTADNN